MINIKRKSQQNTGANTSDLQFELLMYCDFVISSHFVKIHKQTNDRKYIYLKLKLPQHKYMNYKLKYISDVSD